MRFSMSVLTTGLSSSYNILMIQTAAPFRLEEPEFNFFNPKPLVFLSEWKMGWHPGVCGKWAPGLVIRGAVLYKYC